MASETLLLTSLLLWTYAHAAYIQGKLLTSENWAFVARFCFLSKKGVFSYVIEYDQLYGLQNLLFYYDTPEQWPSAYRTGLTCQEKEKALHWSQITSLSLKTAPNCHLKYNTTYIGQQHVLVCVGKVTFYTTRQRWWYLAISNCKEKKGLNMKYKFIMRNGSPGDFWNEHFSADERYMLPILISFFFAYVGIITAVIVTSVKLKQRLLLHTTYKLYLSSVILQEQGIFFQCIAFIVYAVDGVGLPRVRTWGRLLESVSEVVFLLLLLLLAKGYTVTRSQLQFSSVMKLTFFMSLYSITYATLFLYERLYFDPGKVLYLYESPAGYGLIVLRVFAWWLFVYSIIFTLKHYPHKATFYYPFNIVGTLWFVAGPVFILITNSFIDKWVRESVVCGVMHFITFCGHFTFLILTLPMTSNTIFPYHVRTSQVGVLQVPGENGCSFPQYPYAPTVFKNTSAYPVQAEWTSDVPVELFSISRNVDTQTCVTSMRPETMQSHERENDCAASHH